MYAVLAAVPAQGQQQAYIDHFVGLPGIGSQSGQDAQAHFYNPGGLWTDGTTLYVAAADNLTIRKIALDSGIVTTIAGGLQQPIHDARVAALCIRHGIKKLLCRDFSRFPQLRIENPLYR